MFALFNWASFSSGVNVLGSLTNPSILLTRSIMLLRSLLSASISANIFDISFVVNHVFLRAGLVVLPIDLRAATLFGLVGRV